MRHLIRRAVLVGRPIAPQFSINSAPCLATGASWDNSIETIPSICPLSSAARRQLSEEGPTYSSSHDIHILLKEDRNASAPNLSHDDCENLIAELEERYRHISSELSKSDPIGQISKISKFVWDSSRLWASGNKAQLTCISRGAQLTEKLVHLLLKGKEKEISKGILESSSLSTEGGSIQTNNATGMRTDFHSLCIIALRGLARSALDDRGERAQAIVDSLEDLYAKSGNQNYLAPTLQMYNLALVAYAKSGNGDDVVGAENIHKCIALLDRMKEPGASVKADAASYNILLDAYSRLGDAKSAQRVLEELEGTWERSGTDKELMPDVVSYSSVLSAWERSGDRNAAQKAEAILLRMVEFYQQTDDKRVAPNQFTFGTCIALHAQNQHDRNNVKNAERMLDWLLQIHRESEYSEDTAPNGSHFASVLNGWSKSRRHDAGIRAEETLQKMENLYNETGSPSLKPNHQCFVFCVDAWARSSQHDATKNAERILNKMESLFLDDSVDENDRMNNFAYNILASMWAKTGQRGSSERIRDIIRHLTDLSNQTNNEGLAPDKFTYTSLMRALVNEKSPGNLEKCIAVLDRMEEFAERMGKESIMPDEMAYATIMNGYSRDGNVQKVESLIRRMKQKNIQCTDMVYNILLSAIVKSKAHNVGESAEEILRQMEQESEDGNSSCRPSIVSYITCLKALSRSHSPNKINRAIKLLDEVVQKFESGDECFRPSDRVLGSVLDVIAKSDEPHKVSMCLSMIDRMQKEYGVTANRVAYNIVLSACAHHVDPSNNEQLRHEVLKTAVSTFQELSRLGSLGGADSSSYRYLFLVVDNFIQDGGERMASMEDLWDKCCKDGQVNQWVLQALFKVTGPHFWRLVGKDRRNAGIVRVEDLPPEWSRNASVRVGTAAYQKKKKRKGAPRREHTCTSRN